MMCSIIYALVNPQCPTNQTERYAMSEAEHNYETVQYVRAKDGSVHPTVEAAQMHDKRKSLESMVVGYCTAAGLKGRAKGAAVNTVTDFLAWNHAGKPEKWGNRAVTIAPAPEPVAEAELAEDTTG